VTDDAILTRASAEGVLLVTSDKDFGELVYRQRRSHAGVLLLRLSGLDEAAKCDLVSQAVGERGSDLAGAFSVLGGDALRIRKVPGA
jgi:predicted nuclease of predicted toxin-antitoxin system